MENWMVLISLLFLLVSVRAHPDGPPKEACVSMFPTGHGYDAEDASANPGFKIDANQTTYAANEEITVMISGSGQYYEGVFIQARVANCDGSTNEQAQGMFMLEAGESLLKTMNCGSGTKNAVSHLSSAKQYNNTLTWKAPATAVGTIYFRGTFVVEREEFWTTISSDFVRDSTDSSTPAKCDVQTSSGLSVTVSSLGFLLCTALSYLLTQR